MNEATQIVRDASGCVCFAAVTLYISTLIPSHPVQKITNIVIGSGLIYVSCRMEKLEKMLLPYEAIADKQRLITCQEWLEGMEILFENPDDLNQQSAATAPAPTTSAASATTSAASAHLYQLLYQQSWTNPSATSATHQQSASLSAPLMAIVEYAKRKDSFISARQVQSGIAIFKQNKADKIREYFKYLATLGYGITRGSDDNLEFSAN